MNLKTFILLLSALVPMCATAQRRVLNLSHWQFSRDSIHWQSVVVPHDWAISGPFDKKWDLQYVAITQNGETEKTEKSGRSGALPWIGRGYYETVLDKHLLGRLRGRRAVLAFDGAMSEPHVWVNGHYAGCWAYGYNAFRLDITPYLADNQDNLITVSLNNREESSRWYPGAGLYRPVHLILTDAKALDSWSVFARTLSADSLRASVLVSAALCGQGPADGLRLLLDLTDAEGHAVAHAEALADDQGQFRQTLSVSRPRLWSPETPSLYTLRLTLRRNRKTLDTFTQRVGIRTLSVDRERGFCLNGVSRRLKGVCLHHDLGPLGSAVSKAALIRQVCLLKDMGCDAIRTSHNMPSQMQMEVYDSLGMMVMAESFDMWVYPKCKNGYARFFSQWSDRDITNLVLANRNHPSLVMYSIGNEIPEQWSDEGRQITLRLQDLCHRLDPTRPVTQGMDRAEDALRSGFAQVMDIPGFNYRVYKYGRNIRQLPQGFLLGSETASTVSSRGVYKFPVRWSSSLTYPDGQCNGYDTQWCSWSNLPEEDFLAEDQSPYLIGQFVWTGFDYLGEPTPYDTYWPSRSSYFGIFDLAGLPKDRFYLYRSQWNRKSHTVHVLPHWTWPGREGEVTPVFVYTDYPAAELFVNGRSQGVRRKQAVSDGEWASGRPADAVSAREHAAAYRLMWDDVRYEPGLLRVVAFDAEGHEAATEEVRTAGQPVALRLTADRDSLQSDGEDLCFVTVSLVDSCGTEVPTSSDRLRFEVAGEGTFRCVCNGDATSLEPFTRPEMRLFSGRLVVTVQSASRRGRLVLRVFDEDRPGISGQISVRVQ